MKRKMGKSNFKSNFYIGKMGLGTKGNAVRREGMLPHITW